jgi:hypothetical protein
MWRNFTNKILKRIIFHVKAWNIRGKLENSNTSYADTQKNIINFWYGRELKKSGYFGTSYRFGTKLMDGMDRNIAIIMKFNWALLIIIIIIILIQWKAQISTYYKRRTYPTKDFPLITTECLLIRSNKDEKKSIMITEGDIILYVDCFTQVENRRL